MRSTIIELYTYRSVEFYNAQFICGKAWGYFFVDQSCVKSEAHQEATF